MKDVSDVFNADETFKEGTIDGTDLSVSSLEELVGSVGETFCEMLFRKIKEKGLTDFTHSLMQVLSETTGLDEGYMPLTQADNRLTRQISKQLTNHLKI